MDIIRCPPQASAFACTYHVYFSPPGFAQILPSLSPFTPTFCPTLNVQHEPPILQEGMPSPAISVQPASSPTSLNSCVLVCTARLIMSLLLHSVTYKSCFLVSLHVTGGSGRLSASQAVRQKEQGSGKEKPALLSLINSACSRHLISLTLRALQVKGGSGLSAL